ncbi:HAAS domain-containing protein [Paenibacillus hodogayensis]|uniref:HAAS domain-containing protein n=1 Tax=Paenibacillus hodogayensis TaxID=279208 RepID=A0ABV5VPC4_9BACL
MLSPQADSFLTDLKTYLTVHGKNEREIAEIIGELEDHLYEAEKNGKPIEAITGSSPKAYMDQLKDEMKTDWRGIASLLMPLFPLALAFIILPDALRGKASYTIADIIGTISVLIFGTAAFVLLLRRDSSRVLSRGARKVWYVTIAAVPLAIFIGVQLLDKTVPLTPLFVPTAVQNQWLAAICLLFLIGYSLIARTWVTILIPLLLIVPGFAAERWTASGNGRAWLTLGIMVAAQVLLLGYLWLKSKRRRW